MPSAAAIGDGALTMIPGPKTLGILVVLVTLTPAIGAGTTHLAPSETHSEASGAATVLAVHSDGQDPQNVLLNWTPGSFDPSFLWYNVSVATAGPGGPWTNVSSISQQATVYYLATGLHPGSNYWWSVFDVDRSGSQQSSRPEVTLPAVPTLSVSQPSAAVATLAWLNLASYGGRMGFESYTVMESVSGAAAIAVDTITSVSTTGYTALGLLASTSYSFFIITTDTALGTSFTASQTAEVTMETPAPLTASSQVAPGTIGVGDEASLSCAAVGGFPPFNYSWAFGDGQTAVGASVLHLYGSAGAYTATCTVHDARGGQTSSSVAVTVGPPPFTLNSPSGYAIVGVLIAVGAIAGVIVLLILRRGKGQPPPPPGAS